MIVRLDLVDITGIDSDYDFLEIVTLWFGFGIRIDSKKRFRRVCACDSWVLFQCSLRLVLVSWLFASVRIDWIFYRFSTRFNLEFYNDYTKRDHNINLTFSLCFTLCNLLFTEPSIFEAQLSK